MTLVEKVKDAAQIVAEQRSSDLALKQLAAFFQEKQREGVVLKQEYDLPILDTIGRTAYRSK